MSVIQVDPIATKLKKLEATISLCSQLLVVLGDADKMWKKGLKVDSVRDPVGTNASFITSLLKPRVDSHMATFADIKTDALLRIGLSTASLLDPIDFTPPLTVTSGKPWQVKALSFNTTARTIVCDPVNLNYYLKRELGDGDPVSDLYVGPFEGFNPGDIVLVESAEDAGNNGFYELGAMVSGTVFPTSTPAGQSIANCGITLLNQQIGAGSGDNVLATNNVFDTKAIITLVQKDVD